MRGSESCSTRLIFFKQMITFRKLHLHILRLISFLDTPAQKIASFTVEAILSSYVCFSVSGSKD